MCFEIHALAGAENIKWKWVVDHLRSWVRVLDLFNVHRLQADDRNLSALEQGNPEEKDKEEQDLKGRVRRGLVPRRVVPLSPDTVQDDDECEDQQPSGPPV